MPDERKTQAELEAELTRLSQEAADLRAALAAEKASRPVEGMPGDYDLLFETLAEALLVVRVRDGLILRANPCCRRLLGLAEGNLAGKTLYHFLPEAVRPRAEAIIREAAAGSRLIPQHEAVYGRPDGTNVAIEVGGAILGDEPDTAALLHLTDITESREALRESQQELQAVQDMMADGILIADAETRRFVHANPAMCRMLGYTQDELLTKSVDDIHPRDRLSEVLRLFDAQVRGEIPFAGDVPCLRKDGSVFHAEISTSRITLGGRPCAMGVFRDVAERRKAEEALRESEAELRSVQDTMVDALVIVDIETQRLVRLNPAAYRMFGYEPGELDSEPVHAIHPPEDVEFTNLQFRNRLQGIFNPVSEIRCRRKDGTEFVADMNAAPITIRGRRCTMGVFRDITERKKVEEALRQSEENYRLLFESNMNGIAIIGPDGRIVRANNAYCDIHRFPPEKITGMSLWDLVAPHHREDLRQRHEALFRGEITAYSGNFRIVRGDGTAGWVEVIASRMTWEGRPARLAIVQDITERVRLENELHQAQKMEAVGQLAGGIAHDFNNLLTGILCSAQFLKAGPGISKDVYETADVIEKAARRAAELTGQLLGFARRGKHQDVPVDLGATIRSVIRLLGSAVDPRIAVETALPREPLWIRGDPAQMEQVVLNLAMNARDAMSGSGRLTFAVDPVELAAADCVGRPRAKPGRYVVLRVGDTGCGIPDEIRDRIFDPFFTTKPVGKGTGMGLAMVYGIARNHGGWVEVDSAVGQGSKFRVYLPAFVGPVPQSPADPDGGAEKKGRRTRSATAGRAASKRRPGGAAAPCILVVDDDEMVRKTLARMLADHGYSVVTAADGREAVATYGMFGSSLDVVIIDMAMPDMDGRECFQALRRLDPHVRAILCTGGPADEEAREMVGKGIVDFVQKPYQLEQLEAAIAKALARRRGGAPKAPPAPHRP